MVGAGRRRFWVRVCGWHTSLSFSVEVSNAHRNLAKKNSTDSRYKIFRIDSTTAVLFTRTSYPSFETIAARTLLEVVPNPL
jgi:hypothetical protein